MSRRLRGVVVSPDAIIVAPATFNTINKWAVGISDTLALGLLTEAIGRPALGGTSLPQCGSSSPPSVRQER
jgi:Flavoprotein